MVLYQLLTGQLPFRGDSTLEALRAVTNDEPVRPRRWQHRLPRDLEDITLHCREKEPARRYPTALALAEDLQRFREGKPVLARPVGAAARMVRWSRRKPLVATLLLLAGTFLLGLGGVLWQWQHALEERQAAERERDTAARERNTAERERDRAHWQAYRADVAAAASTLQLHDVGAARPALEDAPEEYRNWEWSACGTPRPRRCSPRCATAVALTVGPSTATAVAWPPAVPTIRSASGTSPAGKRSQLGWPPASIHVIDADLGQAARTTAGRSGFQELVTRVSTDQVGIILSYEVTRLARNCTDWYPLLDVCGFRRCLIADCDGVYDPGSVSGRLLLGLK